MRLLFHFYRLLNLLSIDVAAGAVICATWFARLLNIDVRPAGLAALGLTVWIIYTLDHLRDARKIESPAASARHRYHQQNFSTLLVAVGIMIVADMILLFFIRQPVFMWGALLAGIVFVYLAVSQYLIYLKEIMVALLYCVGILLPSLSQKTSLPSHEQWLLIGLFFIVSLSNLMLFSFFDYDRDIKDHHKSMATSLGKQNMRVVLILLFALQMLMFVIAVFVRSEVIAAALFLVMGVVLLLLFCFPSYFERDERYRLIGDGIFILPLIFLLV